MPSDQLCDEGYGRLRGSQKAAWPWVELGNESDGRERSGEDAGRERQSEQDLRGGLGVEVEGMVDDGWLRTEVRGLGTKMSPWSIPVTESVVLLPAKGSWTAPQNPIRLNLHGFAQWLERYLTQ